MLEARVAVKRSKAQIQVIEVLQRVCISRISVPFTRRAALQILVENPGNFEASLRVKQSQKRCWRIVPYMMKDV